MTAHRAPGNSGSVRPGYAAKLHNSWYAITYYLFHDACWPWFARHAPLEGGFDVSVTAVDTDHPLARRVLEDTRTAYDDVFMGDLRTVPISQRSYDVVYCARLLEHVRHVELVLDRLVRTLKPGGLLLIRTRDRYSAAGLFDRLLPARARKALWSRMRPGIPGPFPTVYEKTSPTPASPSTR